MPLDVVGKVAELWRYPVKSMQGQRIDAARFGATGMDGDRQWALRERASGKVASAKRHGRLLEASARLIGDSVEIELPDGRALRPGDPTTDEVLSGWLGIEVRFEHASVGRNGVYEFAFDVDDDPSAEWFDIETPEGSFADLAHAHLLTTASIRAAAPDGSSWDRRRFRPSILIQTADASGYVEDAWVGRRVRIGESLVLAVDMPTIRCVMPTRAQPGNGGEGPLDRDKSVARLVTDGHGGNLGVYCSVVEPGLVGVGDEVVVEPA